MRQKLAILVISLVALAGCFTGQSEQVPLIQEGETINFSFRGVDHVFFTEADALEWVAHEMPEQLVPLTEHFSALKRELSYIEEHQLHLRDAGDPAVTAYRARFEQAKKAEANAATLGAFYDLYDQNNGESEFLSLTSIANPVMSKGNRNRASFWRAYTAGPLVLCDSTWFGGSKYPIFAISPGFGIPLTYFDNRTESFF